ncbi:MAG: GNAT family N-acetyltransferase [Nitrospira sp.]|nr:GNAT family N-acetyltransferase [Nitrospira sp.]
MSEPVKYSLNKASEAAIIEHLRTCDADFVPLLSGRVEINDYAQKIASKATRFEAWSGDTLIGLVAAYCNNQENRIAYITSVSVLREWMGKGVATCLMRQCIENARASGMWQISLEVAEDNMPAIVLYKKSGFVAGKENASFISMNLNLKSGEEHERQTRL